MILKCLERRNDSRRARQAVTCRGGTLSREQSNGEQMYNVIITKTYPHQKHSFSPKFTKCRLAARLRPNPLRSLNAPQIP